MSSNPIQDAQRRLTLLSARPLLLNTPEDLEQIGNLAKSSAPSAVTVATSLRLSAFKRRSSAVPLAADVEAVVQEETLQPTLDNLPAGSPAAAAEDAEPVMQQEGSESSTEVVPETPGAYRELDDLLGPIDGHNDSGFEDKQDIHILGDKIDNQKSGETSRSQKPTTPPRRRSARLLAAQTVLSPIPSPPRKRMRMDAVASPLAAPRAEEHRDDGDYMQEDEEESEEYEEDDDGKDESDEER